MSLWIKICGNTSLEDTLLAAGTAEPADRTSSARCEAGADAVGFVFAPSPRRVTSAQVAAIVPHLPASLEKIGVFVDASFAEIVPIVESCGLTGVQLHFDAPANLPAELRARFGAKLRILRVVHFAAAPVQKQTLVSGSLASGKLASGRLASGHDFTRAERAEDERAGELLAALAPEACFSDPNIDAILVDSRSMIAAGGTGLTFDWSAARQTLFQNPDVRQRLVAAGGLTPENVAEAIAILQPWGVDVVSGVEAAPGRKDPAKVRAFIAAARKAHDELPAITRS